MLTVVIWFALICFAGGVAGLVVALVTEKQDVIGVVKFGLLSICLLLIGLSVMAMLFQYKIIIMIQAL